MALHPKFRAEAQTHLKLRAFLRKRLHPPAASFKGDQSPFEEPPASEGTREIISERSSIMKKDIKFSTRMASADREKDQGTGGEGPHVHERLCHRLLSRQADRGHRRAEGTAPPAQRASAATSTASPSSPTWARCRSSVWKKLPVSCPRSAPRCGQSWKVGEPYGHRTFCELQAGHAIPRRHARRDALRHAGKRKPHGRAGRSSAASTASRRASTTIS